MPLTVNSLLKLYFIKKEAYWLLFLFENHLKKNGNENFTIGKLGPVKKLKTVVIRCFGNVLAETKSMISWPLKIIFW